MFLLNIIALTLPCLPASLPPCLPASLLRGRHLDGGGGCELGSGAHAGAEGGVGDDVELHAALRLPHLRRGTRRGSGSAAGGASAALHCSAAGCTMPWSSGMRRLWHMVKTGTNIVLLRTGKHLALNMARRRTTSGHVSKAPPVWPPYPDAEPQAVKKTMDYHASLESAVFILPWNQF